MIHQTVRKICLIACVGLGLAAPALADDSVPETRSAKTSAADQIKGEWVQYRDTAEGRYMTIKQHLGDHTILTTYDPQQKPIYSHRSDYEVDESGDVNVFRYHSKVVLVGPNAGARSERKSAYVFRVDGDQFYEVHGMLPGDQGRPKLAVWQRLKNSPIAKPKT
ncbi:hypothetical protein NHH03_19785 [Stieleria sp. TO1_6]|uniref:hypothetical protein n=1 Tax=Stieleria tagensis TaxID=2956795 RepID=UPI00209A9A27|nr:hypothetical protein [Stieleria tagensis]MCO8123995.1 hypothetical protein [Stieleria tagensis]